MAPVVADNDDAVTVVTAVWRMAVTDAHESGHWPFRRRRPVVVRRASPSAVVVEDVSTGCLSSGAFCDSGSEGCGSGGVGTVGLRIDLHTVKLVQKLGKTAGRPEVAPVVAGMAEVSKTPCTSGRAETVKISR